MEKRIGTTIIKRYDNKGRLVFKEIWHNYANGDSTLKEDDIRFYFNNFSGMSIGKIIKFKFEMFFEYLEIFILRVYFKTKDTFYKEKENKIKQKIKESIKEVISEKQEERNNRIKDLFKD